eukprot:gene3706-6595_t
MKNAHHLNKLIKKEIKINPPKHLLVFVNPVSGIKKSKEVYEKISVLFKKVGIKLSTIYTKKRYQAEELIKKMDISEYSGIICVSGDGTLNEIVNGLMSRKDSEKVIKIPLGIIPCGSGNGLAKSMGFDTPEESALKIIHGNISSIDLFKVEQKDKTTYAFLIVAFGIVSDSDIESEWLRFLGGVRFALYVLYLLIIKRLYKMKITLKTHNDEIIVLEDEFIYTLATNLPWITDDMRTSPFAKQDDGLIDFQVVRGSWSRWKMLIAFLEIDNANHIEHELLEYWKVKEINYEIENGKSRFAVDGEILKQQNTKVTNISKMARIFS